MQIKQVNEQNPISVKDSLLDFWKGFISYNGKTPRKAFWIGVVEYFVVIALNNLIFGTLNSDYAGGVSGKIFTTILFGVLLIMQIPLTALAFRRLRDAGMKTLPITLIVLINCAFSIAFVFFPMIALVKVGLIVCQCFMVLLFCVPSNGIQK